MGEGRLKEIESHKRCDPEPVGAVIMRQQQADEDETAGESADDHFHSSRMENTSFVSGHNPIFFMFRYCRLY